MGSLDGRRALITGASRGIGRAIALRFAEEGANLVLTDLDAASVEPVCAEARERGSKAVPMSWDVTDYDATATRLAAASEALGGLDVVVNNAGVVRLPESHPDQSRESWWDFIMNANLKGLWFVAEAAGNLLAKAGGVIVNIASDAGLRGVWDPYGLSKWGVVGYTRGLARRLADKGVRVNAVAPGPVATQMMNCDDDVPKENPEQPLGRYSYANEVADVVLFLATDQSRAVFGQIVGVNTKEY
jgi:3-oxoacyl-[acyl-carrier protein] reductase